MSHTSKMCFFSTMPLVDAVANIRALLAKCDETKPTYVTRYTKPWESWQRVYVEGDEDYTNESVDIEYVRTEIEKVAELYLPEGYLRVTPLGNPFGYKIADAVMRNIPESVRGEFAPINCVLAFGYSDIIDESEPEEARLLGQSYFSCSFWQYGSPSDPVEFERQLFQIPEVLEVQRELETIVGPLERCFYFVG